MMIYGHDFNKNVTEIFSPEATGEQAFIVTCDYTPYGSINSVEGDMEISPFYFSSEYFDSELGLVYYNYRHYNPSDGRWINRDFLNENSSYNLYNFVYNIPTLLIDILGLASQLSVKSEGTWYYIMDKAPSSPIPVLKSTKIGTKSEATIRIQQTGQNLKFLNYTETVSRNTRIYSHSLISYYYQVEIKAEKIECPCKMTELSYIEGETVDGILLTAIHTISSDSQRGGSVTTGIDKGVQASTSSSFSSKNSKASQMTDTVTLCVIGDTPHLKYVEEQPDVSFQRDIHDRYNMHNGYLNWKMNSETY